MVEFAISLWVFLFVGFGVFEGAMLAFNDGTLQHAVEEGARVALRPSTASAADVRTVVHDAGTGLDLQPSDIKVEFCPSGGACNSLCTPDNYPAPTRPADRQIRVCATYTYHPLFLSLIVGSSTLTLQRQAQVRSE